MIKPYSDKTAELIDQEVRELITGVYKRTKDLLIEKREGLEALAVKLLEKEILFQSDLEEILGKRPFDNRTTYDEFVNGIEGGDQTVIAENIQTQPIGDSTEVVNNDATEEVK